MPVSQCLQQSRIIMVGKFIDEEYANQVTNQSHMVGTQQSSGIGWFPPSQKQRQRPGYVSELVAQQSSLIS